MDIKGYGHIYKIIPDGWYNEDKTITVNLKCVPKPDFEVQVELESTYGMTERRNKGREFIAKYVESIDGLVVDGKPVTDYLQLYETGPIELYDWIQMACLSQHVLNKAEIKNS